MSQDNDPWGKQPKNNKGGDFQILLDKLKETLFGKGGDNNQNRRNSNNNSNDSNPFVINPKVVGAGVVVVFILWLFSGFYIVKEGYNGVETFLGKYNKTTGSGPNWRWPFPIGNYYLVDTKSIRTMTVGISSTSAKSSDNEGQMLTSDENIVDIGLSVQYRIKDPEKYLFNVSDPELVLKETIISSIREAVGSNGVDNILTIERSKWPYQVDKNLKATLKGFDVGIEISRVELREAKAPEQVQDAFDDAVKAREDAENYKLQAQAYANQKVPIARGDAIKIVQEAQAYKASNIAKATGEASRFDAVLKSYQLSPEVTRTRMYMDTMQKIYSHVSNVILDTGDKSPILYLPVSNSQNVKQPLPPLLNNNANSTDKSSGNSKGFIFKEPSATKATNETSEQQADKMRKTR